ncbi:MAG: family 78 glycoside hydrolase catalytic domain [Candidatus Hodarchaeota archaeon]
MIKPPFNLKCEYLVNPIGIDISNPRFSWVLDHQERNQYQSAYQIIISSEKSLLLSEIGDMWDSGKISSEQNFNIPYKGKPLRSDSTYYWKVKWWDKNNIESNYSQVSTFGTALLDESEWKAKWISRREFIDRKIRRMYQYKSGKRNLAGRIREVHALYFRKQFCLQKPIKTAKIYICGLGYYELRLNGKKVGNRILEPAQTDYNKIALYSTYDINDYLQRENTIGIILGNGRCVELWGYDFPKVIAQLHIHFDDDTNHIICTDESWKLSNGPIQENGIYYGEKYDARLELSGWDCFTYEDTDWDIAAEVSGYNLSSQMMQPIQISKFLTPEKIFSPKAGMYVYDFGQNFSGYVRLKVRGPRGSEVKLRFAEIIHDDGTINIATNGNAPSTDIYILKGDGEEIFEPHFTYHGFRYVELTGFPGVPTIDNIEGLFFHSNVPKVGNFFCSNDLINKIHFNIIWGQLSNLMSIPTDSPQRDERMGWMGDAQLVIEESIYNFDMVRFYSKYLNDIKMSQRRDGSISDVVPPYWRLYPADLAWGTAYITIAWYLYWYYNDNRILEEHYNSLKQYVDFLTSLSEENIVKMGKYGDWCPPSSIVSRKTPVELISTWYYYHDTLLFSKIAKILKKNEDHNFYKAKAEDIKNAFNNKFLKTITYTAYKLSPADRSLSQTSNILPLYLDIVPEKKHKSVLNSLIRAIQEDYDYHFDTGILGTRYIFDALTENGFPEVIYKMIKQNSFPGYGYMIQEGATTLWERWEKLEGGGMNSHNHIMLGSVDAWFYKTLAGITSIEPGWKKVRIKPYIPSDMDYVNASTTTVLGIICSAWEKINNIIKITLKIPVGCNADVYIPIEEKSIIKEGNNIIWKSNINIEPKNQVKLLKLANNHAVFNIGSGYYQFLVEILD